MQTAAFVLLLALAAPAFGGPVSTPSLFPTQENFNKDRFMGKWYDVATASSNPKADHHEAEESMGAWELKLGDSNTVSITVTAFRRGVCKEFSTVYELTETPGRMFHHTKFGTDIDAYVVHTNYDEYAIVAMSKERQGDSRTITFKLFGRAMELRPTLMTDFNQLVKEQGISEDSIILLQKKEKCTPGEISLEPEFQRIRRSVVLPAPVEEGSGDDTPIFRTAGEWFVKSVSNIHRDNPTTLTYAVICRETEVGVIGLPQRDRQIGLLVEFDVCTLTDWTY
ncbi:protein AMBP isoform X2 [Anguilla anguilla]|uniref:protein AMBP isoform X2 n=1 Tax=Anguilla anguilla TaxID=7936 RepID=UPI0015B16006|nr:protein AMBP isoform X2 [Anguilla anguilla]